MPRTLAVLLVPALLLAATPAAPVPKEKPQQHYFPTKVGAKWVYQDADQGGRAGEVVETVTAVEGVGGATVVTISRERDGKREPGMRMSVSEKGVFLLAGPRRPKIDPPCCDLRLPPVPGERWEWVAPEGNLVTKYTARGAERVEVPAGTFTAVRVDLDHVIDRTAHTPEARWYAPGVGLVKWEVGTPPPIGRQTRLLKSFTPGND